MDDLLLFTPSKSSHVAKLDDLLKALLRNGLKVSSKCQLFKTNLHFMGNKIFMQNKGVCTKPHRSILEAIQNYSSHYSKMIQNLCVNGKFSKHVLPRATETIKAHM